MGWNPYILENTGPVFSPFECGLLYKKKQNIDTTAFFHNLKLD